MLHLKLIISLSFSFLLFIDCFIFAKMRILSFILSRKGRFSALERAFSGTRKGVVPKKFSGGQPPNPKFLFASLACPPHILAAGAAPDDTCYIDIWYIYILLALIKTKDSNSIFSSYDTKNSFKKQTALNPIL